MIVFNWSLIHGSTWSGLTIDRLLIFIMGIPIPEKTIFKGIETLLPPLRLWSPFYPTLHTQIAKFMEPTWGPPGSCRPQMGPMLTPWASYQIRKIAGCACAGNAGNVFPRRRFQRKPVVSDPGMHHGTCVTHVPWCMSGSLTCGDGENVPGIPGACAPAISRIWQEAHEPCFQGNRQ